MSQGVTVSYFDRVSGEVICVSELMDMVEVEQNTPPGCGFVLGDLDPLASFVDPVMLIPLARPAVPPMVAAVWDIGALDPAARLVVTDEVGVSTTIPAQSDVLELIDAGIYRVRSESPFPWIDFDIEVTVA